MLVRSLFIVLCVLSVSLNTEAQQTTSVENDSTTTITRKFGTDTSRIIQKKFSKEQVENLKSDPDLNYADPPTVGQTLWSRFLQWLAKALGSLFRNTTFSSVGKIILYALGLTALIYVILALLRINPITVFRKGVDVAGTAEALHENIHEMDFEKLIQEATAKNDFRVGTRLVFLYALKILADHRLIDWNPGKTNYDYVQEIQHPDLKDGFADLSTYFEYAWYGNFKVTPEIFDNIRSAFYSWRTKVEV